MSRPPQAPLSTRIKMTCPIFEGGGAMLEMVRIDGPVDDVDPRREGLQLEERMKRLLAAT